MVKLSRHCHILFALEEPVSNIISETCETIFSSLKGTYLNPPNSSEDWKNIPLQFEEKWNFLHIIGAIDGKHIRIECPKKLWYTLL